MAKKRIKLYADLTDEAMLPGAETMRDLFEDDQPLFEAFDFNLNDAFKSDWDDKINLARKEPSDKTVKYGIAELLGLMDDAWTDCKNHFVDSKYFIEKAFSDKATRETLGYSDFRAMCRYQYKVVPFMDQFHTAASKNKIALIAAGYTQAKIDAIETFTENFREAQFEVNKAKKERHSQTASRADKMNAVWKMVQRVNKASKRVFINNPAKLEMYLLPRKK